MTVAWKRLDWVLMAAVLVLVSLSAVLIWSATSHRTDLTGGGVVPAIAAWAGSTSMPPGVIP